MENNNSTESWFVLLSTYLNILEADGRAWQEANCTAASVDYHLSDTIEQVMDEVAAQGDQEEDIDYGDDMDGDAESALASAGFGTDEDYGCYDGGSDDF